MRYNLDGHTWGSDKYTMFWHLNKELHREFTITSSAAGALAVWRYLPHDDEPGWARARFILNGVSHGLRVTPCPSRRGLIGMARRYVRSQVSVAGQSDFQIAKAAAVEICGATARHIEIPRADGGRARMHRRSVMGVVLGAIRESKR